MIRPDVPRSAAQTQAYRAEVAILRVLWSLGRAPSRVAGRWARGGLHDDSEAVAEHDRQATRAPRRVSAVARVCGSQSRRADATADRHRSPRARLRGLGGQTGDAGASGKRHVAKRARGNPETDRHAPKGAPMTPQLNSWFYTIGWTLVHFVWQGAVIALVISAILAVGRHRLSSQARYIVACLGLVALQAAPLATAMMLRSSASLRYRPSASVPPFRYRRTRGQPCGTQLFIRPCGHRPLWRAIAATRYVCLVLGVYCSSLRRASPSAPLVACRYGRRCRDGRRRGRRRRLCRRRFRMSTRYRRAQRHQADPSIVLLPIALTRLTPIGSRRCSARSSLIGGLITP